MVAIFLYPVAGSKDSRMPLSSGACALFSVNQRGPVSKLRTFLPSGLQRENNIHTLALHLESAASRSEKVRSGRLLALKMP